MKLAYMQSICRGSACENYREVLVTCGQSEKGLAGDEWNLGELTRLSTEDFWTRAKTYTMGYDGHDYIAMEK